MKKTAISILVFISLVITLLGTSAETDFSGMSLEELMEVQEQLTVAIEEANNASKTVDASEPASPELDTTGYMELTIGSKGDEVKTLPTRLFDLGFYSKAIDGDYGNGTVIAIKDFEEFNGLEQTGIATPELQAFLFSENAKHKPVAVSSIKVQMNNPIVLVGSTLDMADIFVVNPENATEKGVIYALDSDEFATIDENGILAAKERGDVTVTVTSKEAVDKPKSATVKVKVRQPAKTLTLNETTVNLGKGNSYQLEATVGPENADDKSVVWTSENQDIAAVSSKGKVTAKACGECNITCTTNDGSGVSSTCHIVITQLVNSIKLPETKITLPKGKTYKVEATVLPEDATNKVIEWTSSDETIAKVTTEGTITAEKGGDCEIICSATDGSEKQAIVKVHVPTFSTDGTEYAVTDKKGLTIPIRFNDDSITITASGGSNCFKFELSGSKLLIDPIRAGSGTIKLSNPDAKEDSVNLKITIDHSAVYDSTSYPKANYENVLRNPYDYSGDTVSIYGKVLQKSEGWGSIVLRVGTGGYGYYDKVFWVEYKTSEVKASVIEDDYITVYGKCTGTHTYETIMGASVTIPAIDAEKIIIGRK